MAKLNVSVSIEDRALGRLSEVATKLKHSGLENHEILKGIGVITGNVEESNLGALRAVPGVSSVETQREVSVVPPDRQVQ